MSRDDFRLDKLETRKKIELISENSEYRLLWLKSKEFDCDYGGVVIHLLGDQLKVAYRCYDHLLAKQQGMSELDYYAEMNLHEYARDMKYDLLCYGNDKHPVDQLGLSIYKLRVGAMPAFSDTANTVETSEEQLCEMSKRSGVAGYYLDLSNGYYKMFNLYGKESEIVNVFIKVANRMGIEVNRLNS